MRRTALRRVTDGLRTAGVIAVKDVLDAVRNRVVQGVGRFGVPVVSLAVGETSVDAGDVGEGVLLAAAAAAVAAAAAYIHWAPTPSHR